MATPQLGRFTLIDRIAIGSLGEVWRASDAGDVVAIRRLLPHFEEDEACRLLFAEDAQSMGSLRHRNIVRVDELANSENFVAMEYVAGRDLKRVIDSLKTRGQRMPIELAAFVVAQLADALEYAHANSTVSHGLSPHHVVLSWTGDVKLVGFGTGQLYALLRVLRVRVPIASMSPEQVRGQKLDGRSDVFALGSILYELLTGASAFQSDSDFSTLERRRVRVTNDAKPAASRRTREHRPHRADKGSRAALPNRCRAGRRPLAVSAESRSNAARY